MIRGIVVQRANVAPAVCCPVQWSHLLQIAVNNGSLLTVLDPKLPTIHTSIIQSSSAQPILDLRALFHLNTEIHISDVIKNERRPLLDVSISTFDQPILFGNFTDLQIVAHKWSFASPRTRNTYLAVLLNTSELFVLERDSAVPVYRVKYNVTEALIDNIRPNSSSSSDISLTNDEYLGVKAISFDFASVDLDPALTISMANGEVKVFMLKSGLPLIQLILFDSVVTKLAWSPNCNMLLACCANNQANLIEFNETDLENIIEVQKPSRFLVSQLQWLDDDYFTVTNTTSLSIYSKAGLKIASETLISNVMVTGISVNKLDLKHTFLIHITFENGQVMKLEFVRGEYIRKDESSSAIESLIARNLFKYQMDHSMKAEDNKGNFSHNNDIVEGKYYNYGTVLNGNVIAMVSRIVPKRAINYTILSKVEYLIDFIPVGELDLRLLFCRPSYTTTSLGHLAQYWINHYSKFPTIPLQLDISTSYIDQLQAFAQGFSTEISSEFIGDGLDLKEFSKSDIINLLQFSLNVNNSVLETLSILLEKSIKVVGKENVVLLLNELVVKIQTANTAIVETIFQCISRVVDQLSKTSSSQEIDDFIAGSYGVKSKSSSIELSSSGVEEVFESDSTDKMVITSHSGHKWRRCNLTMLPILQASNRTSETGMFEYISPVNFNSNLVLQLTELGYCVYTGNRTFGK